MKIKVKELKQETMTVTEYEAKFSELSRFVPEFVNTEEKKASRFQPGLPPTSSPLSGPLNSRYPSILFRQS